MKRRILNILLVLMSMVAIAQTKADCRIDFINQNLNKSMRDYCDSVLVCGWNLVAEMDGNMLYHGKFLGIDDVQVIVSGRPDMESVEASIIIFPKGKHWQHKSDFEVFHDYFIDIYGKPFWENEDKNKIEVQWIFNTVTILLNYDKKDRTSSLGWINMSNTEEQQKIEQPEKKQKKKKQKDHKDEKIDFDSEFDMQALLQLFSENYKKTHKKDDLECILFCCEKLGNIYRHKGWHSTGIQYFHQALQYAAEYEEPKGPVHVELYQNIALAYSDMGDIPKALEYMQEALVLNDQLKSDTSETYFIVLRSASVLYDESGRFAEAEAMNERIFSELAHANIRNKTERYINTLHDQGALYGDLGNYAQAKKYFEEEMAVLRKNYKEPHPRYTICYGGLAAVDSYHKDYRSSLQNEYKALSNIPDPNDRKGQLYAAQCYGNISLCYAYLERPDSAIAAQEKSIEIYRTLYNDQHPKYANALINLAFAYSKKGEEAHSLQLYKKAQNILEKAYNHEHPLVISSIYCQAVSYSHINKYDEAEKNFRESIQLAKANYQHALDYMSEYQREQYWNEIREMIEHEDFNKFLYRLYKTRPSVREFAYDNELFSKGLLLASSNMIRRSIEDSGDPKLLLQYEQLSGLREQIYRMESANSESHDLEIFRHRADSLEKELTRNSAIFRQKEVIWQIDWKDVRNHLIDNQLAIEFTRLQLTEDSAVYAALLLKKGMEHPQLIPLFEQEEVSKILQRTTPDEQYAYAQSGAMLCQTIWGKILPYMHKEDTVYFAATGLLHQIAIETLPTSENQTMSSKYNMVRLSSTRELVIPHTEAPHHSATLYGGIYYDMEMSDLAAYSMAYRDLAFASTRALTDESLRGGVHYLPGTKREVEKIQNILLPNHISAKVYTSEAANEESFKALSGKKQNILHIATHGFYWSDSTAREQRYFSRRVIDGNHQTASIDPLTRSGLLFAGANIALRGHGSSLPANVQDGILTSKEISLLDLRGADMVILSACETGKGEITGEGVFGLQRAFKMAGAQTMLMSLWPVDDEATQMMMSSFYRHWITLRETKRSAFIHAQEEVKQKYPKPSYWAAFILLD